MIKKILQKLASKVIESLALQMLALLFPFLCSMSGILYLKNKLLMPTPLYLVLLLLLTVTLCFLIAIIVHSYKPLKLNETEIKILLFIENHSKKSDVTPESMSYFPCSNLTNIEFYLNELINKKMVKIIHISKGDIFNFETYSKFILDHEGQRYLIKNKLIN